MRRPLSRDLYFAYGSNLNAPDLAGFCQRNGHDAAHLVARGVAWLVDHRVAFTVHSDGRAGGVLDVLPRPGSLVPGLLFEIVHEGGWRLLDDKESVGVKYQRRSARVFCARAEHEVTTYEVLPHLRSPYVRPGQGYLDVVCAGLRAWGLPDEHVRAAARDELHELEHPEHLRARRP
jgi:hypothetical protein